jgi:hypothetical protein
VKKNTDKQAHCRILYCHKYKILIIFIVAPCILKFHLLSHANKCTNYIIYYLKSVLITDIKTLSYFHSSYMFLHITCHPQGALMFLAKITGKTICKKWTYIVWRVWQHMLSHPSHNICSFFTNYFTSDFICCHTLHTIYVNFLKIILPVILARNMSAPWGWHVICRNM